MHWSIDNANYENDHRVRAANSRAFFKNVDKGRMKATVTLRYDDEETGDEIEEDIEVPIKFEVCPTCDGKGTHVNPSIDSNGLTAEDFAEDPDFREDYFSGRYDVACYGCGGSNVVPTINGDYVDEETRKLLDKVQGQREADAEYEYQCARERAMGY